MTHTINRPEDLVRTILNACQPGYRIGPANSHYTFELTLTTLEQLQETRRHRLLIQPPRLLVIHDCLPDGPAPGLPVGCTTILTQISEAELRTRIYQAAPGLFHHCDHIHGTVISRQESGILLRGPAGSGKTSLALALVRKHKFRLVADDAADYYALPGGMLLSACPPSIAGHYQTGTEQNCLRLEKKFTQSHSLIKMSIYLGAKNIQNTGQIALRSGGIVNIAGINIPEWDLQTAVEKIDIQHLAQQIARRLYTATRGIA